MFLVSFDFIAAITVLLSMNINFPQVTAEGSVFVSQRNMPYILLLAFCCDSLRVYKHSVHKWNVCEKEDNPISTIDMSMLVGIIQFFPTFSYYVDVCLMKRRISYHQVVRYIEMCKGVIKTLDIKTRQTVVRAVKIFVITHTQSHMHDTTTIQVFFNWSGLR